MDQGQEWRQYVISAIASLGQACGMMILSWTAPMLSKLGDPQQSPLGRAITSSEESWCGSLTVMLGIIGPSLGSLLARKIGRKGSTMISGVVMAASLLTVTFGTSIASLYAARSLGGLGFGILFTASFLYVSEIASDEKRGPLLTFLLIFGMLGSLLVYAIGPFLSYDHVNYFCTTFCVLFVILFMFMPETPLYFIMYGKREKATLALQFIRGRKDVKEELEKLEAEYFSTSKQKGTIKDLWASRSNMKGLTIACALVMFQQLAAIDVTMIFLMTIFGAAKTNISPEVASVSAGTVQFLASCITPFVINRLGRKPLLLISSIGMAISWALFGMFFKLKYIDSPLADQLEFLPIIVLVTYMIVYSVGYGPIPYVIAGEVFSLNVKDIGSTIAITFNWIVAFVMTKSFDALITTFGMHNCFWFFSFNCTVATIYTWICVPETKGRTITDIQRILDKRLIPEEQLNTADPAKEIMLKDMS